MTSGSIVFATFLNEKVSIELMFSPTFMLTFYFSLSYLVTVFIDNLNKELQEFFHDIPHKIAYLLCDK